MKSIRFNQPTRGEKSEFGDTDGYTFHTGDVTVYFDSIRETLSGYIFERDGVEVAYIPDSECEVSPEVAKNHAAMHAGEKVPFADA